MDDLADPRCDVRGAGGRKLFRCFYLLAVLFAVCAALGMKLSKNTGMLSGLEFYGRYDGLPDIRALGDLTPYFEAVLSRSAPFLISSAVLLILSSSSLLMPAGFIYAGIKGFISGGALCLVRTPSELAQLILYIISAVAGCVMSSVLISLRDEGDGTVGTFFKKASVLLCTNGGYVLCEFILSLII